MDVATLNYIVPSASPSLCASVIPGYNWACRMIGANTVRRCAMLLAQVAEESAGFRATEEYASGSEYEGRTDLGNTHPGDGPRYKGRTFIQITGRNNYGKTSQWAFAKNLVTTPTWFVDHPEELAQMKYAWVGPAQYWLAPHNHGYGYLNNAADAGDIYTGTLMVNGGTNGLSIRTLYWQRALSQGNKILPVPPAPTPTPTPPLVVNPDMFMLVNVSQSDCTKAKVKWPGIFITDGMTLQHVGTPARHVALRNLGMTEKVISLADYHALGGK